jgi:SAM-dependent methyltransferase
LRILFATAAPILQGPEGPTSELASARYRAILPAQQLARLGHAVQIASLPPGGWPEQVVQGAWDAVVISKSFHAENEALARALRERGVKVVVDFCDDHFAHPQFGAHFHALARAADVIVAGSAAMAASVARHAQREAMVVSDPVEGPRGEPRFAPALPRVKLAWFGHPSNLPGLARHAPALRALGPRVPAELTVVTSDTPQARALLEGLAREAPGVPVRLVPWSLQATWQVLAQCDAVWLPVESEAAKAVKSPNRLLEAAWAGRFVVAGELDAYQPFSDVVAVGRELADALEGALADHDGVVSRLRLAQSRIAASHSGYACGVAWSRALGAPVPPLRLNLGCGDKILAGYVNVDVAASRAGMRPDVLCDLHDLAPFADASADEVLAVHVVEHFWRWEVAAVLREWVRVLRPGAPLVVECPNLASACGEFLRDPVSGSRPDAAGQRTMWVFYGDPRWQDPLMVHRWGYTPESLAQLLAEVGLVDVRQEPAQFKLREPRDMRVVGRKPQ